MEKRKKLRILMLYDFPINGGGSGTYVKYLSFRLREVYGYEVAIAAPEKNTIDNSIKNYYIELPQIPVYVNRPGLDGAKKYSELKQQEIADIYSVFIKSTLNAVEEFKPDIIHVHHMMVNVWVARVIQALYGIKFIVTTHGSCLEVISRDKRYFRLTKDALCAANAITAVSSDNRKKLIKMFGTFISASKIRTITGGIRLSMFPEKITQKERAETAEYFNLSLTKKIVLFTGRLINEKGVEYLIKAAGKIDAQIVIAGDGPQMEDLKKYIENNNIINVTFIGFLKPEEVIKLYYIADVFVAPSVWDDPMPLAIIEAMAAGLPLVVTGKGGIPYAVKDGYNGLFVKTRNSMDIVEKVNQLLHDDNLRKKMGENGRKIVEKRFTWTHIAKRFHDLYRNI